MKGFYKRWGKKMLCIALAIAFCLPISIINISAKNDVEIVADSQTFNNYNKWLNLGTKYSGAVWTDKTVVDKPYTFESDGKGNPSGKTTISPKKDNFLAGLSTMSETYSVEGEAIVPMDTVFVLDLSSSMYENYMDKEKKVTRAEAMVDAANSAIKTLLSSNENNRVGVVAYSGHNKDKKSTTVLSKLDTYTDQQAILSHLKIDMQEKYLEGQTGRRDFNSGTNIQMGIYEGVEMLTTNNPDPSVTINGEKVYRSPAMVLLSDGAASYASSAKNWWKPNEDEITGKGNINSLSYEGLGFLAAMTAAYHKNTINEHYHTKDAKIYTIGVGLDLNGGNASEGKAATVTLNPTKENLDADYSENGYAALYKQHWDDYSKGRDFDISVMSSSSPDPKYSFSNANNNILDTPLSFQYNDGYWPSDDIDELNNAFKEIVIEIEKNAQRYPTDLDDDDPNKSGYVTFNDKIGQYMEVKDMKGVLCYNYYTRGGEISELLTKDPSDLTSAQKQDLQQFFKFVAQRLNITDLQTAKKLISNAIRYGQISYNSESDFSNYFAWYADDNNKFLGFCPKPDMQDILNGTTTDDDFPNVPENATKVIKSYSYWNEDLKDKLQDNGNLLYLFSSVQTNLKTAEQTVEAKVPASLIPLTRTHIKESDDEQTVDFKNSRISIQKPLRYLYEVGLREDLDSKNLGSKLSSSYKEENKVPGTNHEYYFYTNEWDRSKDILSKTTANFNPSPKNRFYYFTEDTMLFTDSEGKHPLDTDPAIGQSCYYKYNYYDFIKDGNGKIVDIQKKSVYREVKVGEKNDENQVSIDSIKSTNQGFYYVQHGTQRITDLANVNLKKNSGGTIGNLTESNDTSFVTVWKDKDKAETTYLGNNGRLSLQAETGSISITKTDSADSNKKLSGAEFILYQKDNGNTKYYNGSDWVDEREKAKVYQTDASGASMIDGLYEGDYYLEETKAPQGYEAIKDPVKVTVAFGGDAPFITNVEMKNTKKKDIDKPNDDNNKDKTNDDKQNQTNEAGILPGTGDSVPIALMAALLVILIIAIIIIIKKRNKS